MEEYRRTRRALAHRAARIAEQNAQMKSLQVQSSPIVDDVQKQVKNRREMFKVLTDETKRLGEIDRLMDDNDDDDYDEEMDQSDVPSAELLEEEFSIGEVDVDSIVEVNDVQPPQLPPRDAIPQQNQNPDPAPSPQVPATSIAQAEVPSPSEVLGQGGFRYYRRSNPENQEFEFADEVDDVDADIDEEQLLKSMQNASLAQNSPATN